MSLLLNKKNLAFFLDRDGVVNEDRGYVFNKNQIKWKKNIFKALKYICEHNYKIIIVTNQSGIGRGYYKEKDVKILHAWMKNIFLKKKIQNVYFYYAPYYKFSKQKKYRINSNLRKPNPGMIKKAAKKHKILIKKSFLIGDKVTDLKAGKKAGVKSFIVENDIYKQVQRIINP